MSERAPHLSEFYSFLDKASVSQSTTQQLAEEFTIPASTNASQTHSTTGTFSSKLTSIVRRMSNSTFNSNYAPSTLDLDVLITKGDTKETVDSYDELLSVSEEYRQAMLAMSNIAGRFASALERTSKLKGNESAEGFVASSGMFYVVSNHQQILAQSLESNFLEPLKKEIQAYKDSTLANEEKFRNDFKEKSRLLKQQEKENIKISKSRYRNLLTYRNNLSSLTSKIDEIDKLKHDYYLGAHKVVQRSCENVLQHVGTIVRAEVEIAENIARKGWSGGGLDDLMSQGGDPFKVEGETSYPTILDQIMSPAVSPVRRDARSDDETDIGDDTVMSEGDNSFSLPLPDKADFVASSPLR